MNYMSSVTRPQIPYLGSINGGLHVGKIIEIRGVVPYGADVFQVNLVTGMDTNNSDRALHISVRFNGKVVVRNTQRSNQWEYEEREGVFPFAMGKAFVMRVVAQQHAYVISVDGHHCWSFSHRMPMSRVTSIFVDGTVGIDRVDFMNSAASSVPAQQYYDGSYVNQYPSPFGIAPAHRPVRNQQIATLVPVYNPSIPYTYPISGGLKHNTKIYISARPTVNTFISPHRFTINLQCGSAPYPPPSIAFHFDVRFFNGTVVRNTRTGNSWGPEELAVPHFPFQPNVPFDMLIRMNGNKFMVAVNGQEYVEYVHRIKPLSAVDTLFIEKDIAVSCIRFA